MDQSNPDPRDAGVLRRIAMHASRRQFVLGGAALAGFSLLPAPVRAASAREPRLLVLNLRGALDGLAAVIPATDPHLAALRGDFMAGGTPLPLDGEFLLNPNLAGLHAMYRARELLFVHAVATPYRSRSHFDAQQVLESGYPGVGGDGTGWLNRAMVAAGAAAGASTAAGGGKALAVSPTIPLILRGAMPVESWQPQMLSHVSADLAARLLAVYDGADPALAAALRKGVDVDLLLDEQPRARGQGPKGPVAQFVATTEAVGKLMATPDGPRIAAIAIDGWDTHASQGSAQGRLARQFEALDAGLVALKRQLGPLWADTAVLIVSEFGRTARVNGSRGTDHGTGGLAMLAGGRVAGGRVLADWPGLGPQALFEGRDLRPTTDLRAVLKGVLAETLGLGQAALSSAVFPDSARIKPLQGLLRA